MAIKDRLMDDLKVAMREKNTVLKSTVTMLRAAIKQIEVDTRTELKDDAIIDIIVKQIKQKKSAIEEFKKGERQDLVEEASAEIDLLMAYLPEQLSKEDIIAIIEQAISDTGATSMKEMGKVMGAIKGELSGKADNKFVADTVKALLS